MTYERDNEVAIEDHFKDFGGDAYAGRKYPDKSTEVLTMGIERLHADPALFAEQDPEYFTFVVNTLRGVVK
ncbi:hypothetical protein CfE428DRAFT_4212 [Chthoniobacter flavus Ellin428]|uniref:Uncharacterized protein n=1 Tax=Chthoniobacter flavus Ellin428 TaxID=497964 RepID=B4D5M3_9BACT|nr:hypothetical protein [Chthoniobacter flavus]EDY18428.1 hypothetical protein CfE428DRAFT_4212 [Chthoniobacter flavus Ellin428]TCO90863.1 hypothetical protein EV701_10912 [Chthoniobacter flavus]